MTRVVPIAEKHAIKSVSFGLEWQKPLQVDELTLLTALHARIADTLPRVTPLQELFFQVKVGAPDPSQEPQPAKQQVAGVVFDALQRNGEPAWSLNIQKNILAVNCHVYTRWADIWTQARALMAPFIPPLLLRERGISVIGLQYGDQFKVVEDPRGFRAEDLLRAGTPLVPADVFELEDLWHSHHGYFERHGGPTAHRRLNAVDVDVVDGSDGRLIQVATAHRAMLDKPASDPSRLLNDEGGELEQHMVELHNANKSLLRKLLNDDICDRIALRKPS